MLGRNGVAAVERELEQKRAKLAELERTAEVSARLAGETEREADEIAAAVLAGRITEAAAGKRVDELEQRARNHRRTARGAGVAIEQLAPEIAELERQVVEQPFDELLEKLPELEKAHQAAAAQFAKALKALSVAGATLTSRRDAFDEAIAAAEEACPDWRELDFESADEPEWDGADELVALLERGRRDHVEREAERARRRDEDARKAAAARVPRLAAAIVKGGAKIEDLRDRFDELTSDEQDEVLRRAEASLEQVERAIRAEFSHPDALPGQELAEQVRVERVRQQVQMRIERLREREPAAVA